MPSILEQGLAIHAAKGAANAWVFLIHHGFSESAVARVLAEAGQCAARDRRSVAGALGESKRPPLAR
ncbi:hypothetical protein [Pseudoduganella namucuonensis]|uniref:hypothetical protein n=1 Tax=Pseudoduganella namucuonensis TaxID=1035707 RepID=UPI001160C8C5|nr:hypothetical protein [Pseudoduganella namucuonensis]